MAVTSEGLSRATLPLISLTWLVLGADWIRRRVHITRDALRDWHADGLDR